MGAYTALSVSRRLRSLGERRPSFVALGAMLTAAAVTSLVSGVRSAEDIDHAVIRRAVPDLDHDSSSIAQRVRHDLWLAAQALATGAVVATADDADRALLVGGSDDPGDTLDKLSPDALRELGFTQIVRVPGGHLFFTEPRGREALSEILSASVERALEVT
jgi:hypothetical protein